MIKSETQNKNAKILIVEDELLTAENIKRSLQKHGYVICGITQDAEDAINFVMDSEPDLILMDIMLEGKLTGIEAAQRIQEFADIPIIYLTAYSDDDTIQKAKFTSPFGYIIKPFENRELFLAVEMALFKHSLEMKLKKNEKNLSITLNSIGDGVISTDKEGFVTRMNPVAEKLCGWSLNEAKGRYITEIFNIVDVKNHSTSQNPIEQVIESGEIISLSNNILLISKDGTQRNIADSAAPIFDEKGNIHGAVLVFSDVTEKYNARKELLESEEKFRLLISQMHQGLAVHEVIYDNRGNVVDYRFLEVNDSFEKVTGLKREKIIGKTVLEVLPGTEPYWIKKFGEVVKTGVPLTFEDYSRELNKYFEVNVYRNQPNQFAAIFFDTTYRKNAEEELRRSEEKFRSLYDNSTLGIYRTTPDGKILMANPALVKMLRYNSPEELQKKTLNEPNVGMSKESRKKFKALIEKKGEVKGFEAVWHTKTGSDIYIRESAKAVRDEKGVIIFYDGTVEDITFKKLAEEKIRLSEERYRTLIENVSVGIYYSSVMGEFLYGNKVAEKICGYKAEELIGKNFLSLNLLSIKDIATATKLLALNALGQPTGPNEFTLNRKNGSKVQIEVSTQLITLGNQRVVLGIVNDITEKLRAQEALRESEELHRKLLMTVPDLIIRTNLDGDIIFINEYTFDKLKFIPKENLLGKNILSFVSEKDLQRAIENTKLMFEKPLGVKEYLLSFEDKIEIECEVNGDIIVDADNKPIGMVYVIRDITERKLAEAALRESEERFSKAFKSSPAPLVISEIETGKFIDVNEQWIQMLGYSDDKNIGANSFSDAIWSDPDEYDRAIVILKREGYIKNISIRLVTKSGQLRDAFWSAEKITFGGKEVMLSMIYDFTEQKNIQEALIESQKLSAIGEMSSAIAHDFNNSLQSILGNLELAFIRMHANQPIKKYLDTIKTAVTDALTRVQLLQRFAGKSKSRYEYNPINLNQVVKDVIVQTRPLWKDNVQKEGSVIRFETSYADIPTILGNEGELRSAVYNLIKNSLEAMPRGGVIKIKTSCKDNKVYLSCIDTGTGMDEETKSRVFQPFFSTKGFEAGRGMGMVNAYSIIKEHGGKLEVIMSQPGKGTEIQIVLPVSDIQEKAEVMESKNSDVDITANILWVDDDNLIRDVAAEMLEVLGHKGDVVGSGEEALIKLNENSYDLVVTDIGMPGMNGWELADKIRELYKGKIKVAVLTGWGDQIDDDEKQRHGVSFIIGKPFRIEQIERLITEAVILGKDDR